MKNLTGFLLRAIMLLTIGTLCSVTAHADQRGSFGNQIYYHQLNSLIESKFNFYEDLQIGNLYQVKQVGHQDKNI